MNANLMNRLMLEIRGWRSSIQISAFRWIFKNDNEKESLAHD